MIVVFESNSEISISISVLHLWQVYGKEIANAIFSPVCRNFIRGTIKLQSSTQHSLYIARGQNDLIWSKAKSLHVLLNKIISCVLMYRPRGSVHICASLEKSSRNSGSDTVKSGFWEPGISEQWRNCVYDRESVLIPHSIPLKNLLIASFRWRKEKRGAYVHSLWSFIAISGSYHSLMHGIRDCEPNPNPKPSDPSYWWRRRQISQAKCLG